jgi:epsilon-lactone hydrolase
MEGIDAVRELIEQSVTSPGLRRDSSFMRKRYDELGARMPVPPGMKIEKAQIGLRPGLKITPPDVEQGRTILYLHGGGYEIGSPESHKAMVAHFAEATKAVTWLLDYRLAPENPFPAALEDATAAWGWLLTQKIDPAKSAILGDSAGGGLTISTAIAARKAKLPLPRALVVFSPWVNLAQEGAMFKAKAEDDPVISKAILDEHAAKYLGDRDPKATVLASPLFADLSGLPETLIQVGSEEVLLGDADALLKAMRKAGVNSVLEIWPNMIHVWHYYHAILPEAREAITEVGSWLARRLAE